MALPSTPVAHSIVRKEVPLPNKDSQDTRRSDLELGEGDTSSTAELLPTDRGAAAWKVLLGAFVFEAILWGKYAHPHLSRHSNRVLLLS